MAEITRLPGPVADLWDWQLDGACRGVSPEVFFHPEASAVLAVATATPRPRPSAPPAPS
jgi:hypothetical protein